MRTTKLWLALVALVVSVAGTAIAQAPAPTAKVSTPGSSSSEVFVGYLFQPTDWGTTKTNGIDANYTYFFTNRIGVVLDVDYARAGETTNISSVTGRVGPRVNLIKNSRIQPYVDFLVGGANLTADVRYPGFSGLVDKSWHGLTWAGGGGIDFHLTHHLGARFQGDWTHLPYGNHDSSDWQRLAFGATWKW